MKTALRLLVTSLIASAVLVIAQTGQAQNVVDALVSSGPERNSVTVGTSFDPALAFDFGYTRRVSLRFGAAERNLALSGSWSAIPGFGSWDAGVSAALRLRERTGFDVLARGGLTLKRVSNAVHTGAVYGYELGVFPGYYRNRWWVAGELSIRQMVGMTVRHSDAYRGAFPDARDGTYALGGFHTFVGLGTGVRIRQRGLLGMRFAWRFQNGFDSYLPYYQPYTFMLHGGLRF